MESRLLRAPVLAAVLVPVGLTIALAAPSSGRGDVPAGPVEVSWVRAYEMGAEHLRSGDLDAAVRELRLAVVLNPTHASARASLRLASESLQSELLREAELRLEKKEIRPAVPRLKRAAELPVRGKSRSEAVRLLRSLGFEQYERGWEHREDVIALEKRAMRIARNRSRELELPGGFVLHRRARVRVFTDLDPAGDPAYFDRLLSRLQEAITTYRRLFLPFELDESWEGLDVVLFAEREDYVRETSSPDTLGMFLPSRRASYFLFARPRAVDDPALVRVLFHEVCHQLDYKLLGMTRPPPWLQEGLAFCFERMRPGPEGTCELAPLGRDTRRHLAEVCPPGSPRWLGLARLVGTRDLRPFRGTPEIHDFYAQACGLVYFLLASSEDDPRGPSRRALFYRLVAAARAEDARPDRALEDFRHLLGEAAWAPGEFEKNFVQAISGMSE